MKKSRKMAKNGRILTFKKPIFVKIQFPEHFINDVFQNSEWLERKMQKMKNNFKNQQKMLINC